MISVQNGRISGLRLASGSCSRPHWIESLLRQIDSSIMILILVSIVLTGQHKLFLFPIAFQHPIMILGLFWLSLVLYTGAIWVHHGKISKSEKSPSVKNSLSLYQCTRAHGGVVCALTAFKSRVPKKFTVREQQQGERENSIFCLSQCIILY